MDSKKIEGQSIQAWMTDFPLLYKITDLEEVFWVNPNLGAENKEAELTEEDINDAAKRLERFAPYIETAFPETKKMRGIIESPLLKIPKMKQAMEDRYNLAIYGELLLKGDSHLPISGSIKARGGIYEVLKYAEGLALKHGLLTDTDSYAVFQSENFKDLFSTYRLAVGSTGNLGLSIGIMGAKLGFEVTVHMSADAKEWKKEKLRSLGVKVVEYRSDYGKAVEEGRKEAQTDPSCYFIDDENSKDLFLGYAVAGARLKAQLAKMNKTVDADHPLFVYLPCGVGGAPGGITFGLKKAFGDHVHCFFAEPTHSPSFLIGQMTGLQDKVSVFDFGLDNKTDADGLAVGRPSRFVGKAIGHVLSGCYTISDHRLYTFLRDLADTESIFLEPSSLAGFYGPIQLLSAPAGQQYLTHHHIKDKMQKAHHVVWATGGSMVPKEVMENYYLESSQ
jgi:D-serine dehydratase